MLFPFIPNNPAAVANNPAAVANNLVGAANNLVGGKGGAIVARIALVAAVRLGTLRGPVQGLGNHWLRRIIIMLWVCPVMGSIRCKPVAAIRAQYRQG